MGEDEPNLTRAHFSDGLVQPPTSDSLRYTFSQFKFVASLECVRGPAAKVAKDGGDVVSIHALETLKLSVLKGCFFFSFQNHFPFPSQRVVGCSFRISEASYMLHLKTSGAAAEC